MLYAMKDTYYINKEYHTLVRATYNTTQREYCKKDCALRRAFDREYDR